MDFAAALQIALLIGFLISAVVLHETSHGAVAFYLGDPTAKERGRLTLNPLRHIDLFWTILFPALLFFSTHGRFALGMAKPVPVDFSRLRRPKTDMIWVAAAGPVVNLLLASLFSLAWRKTGQDAWLFGVYLNLGLAVFNLIPIPPLDGSRIVTGLLPVRWAVRYARLESYGFLIVLALYALGVISRIILPGIEFLCRLLHVPLPGAF